MTFEIPEQTKALVARGENLVIQDSTFSITSTTEFEAAAEQVKAIKSLAKEIDAGRKELTVPLDAQKKAVMDWFRPSLDSLKRSESFIKQAMANYQRQVEQERRRMEAEQQAVARKEREKLERAAQRAAKGGHSEKADMLSEQAASVAVPIAASSKPDVSGISSRKTWHANVTDKMALLKAIVDGKVPDIAVDVNMKFLNNQARALNTSLNYPGVEVVEDTTMAVRAS